MAGLSPKLTLGANLKSSAQISQPKASTNVRVFVSPNTTTARESQREEMEDTLTPQHSNDLQRKGTILANPANLDSLVDERDDVCALTNGSNLISRDFLRNGHHHDLHPPNSPDSGYGLTPDVDGVTSSRSRSCSSETTGTYSNEDSGSSRRATGSSGVPSSLYSGHESTLEFVAEQEDDEIGKNDCIIRGREKGSTSDGGGGGNDFFSPSTDSNSQDPESSVIGPLIGFNYQSSGSGDFRDSSVSMSGSYFSPDGTDILVPVMKRKGIQRSTSLEDEFRTKGVPFNNTSVRSVTTQPSSSRRSPSKNERRRTTLGRKSKSVIKDSSGRPPFLIEGKDTFQIQDDLSKDNHHFSLSEALLCVIEEYKSRLHEQAYDEYLTRRSISSNSSDTLCSPTQLESYDDPDSFMHSAVYIDKESNDRVVLKECKIDNDSPRSFRESTISLHQKWLEENYRANISRASSIGDTVSVLRLINSPAPSDSAEGTANGLLQHIAKVLAGNAQVEFRIPQKTIQLPSDFVASIQQQEMLRYSVSDTSVPIRGNSDWAPPRRQVFHNVFLPPNDIRGALVAQGCKCAGCSMTLDLTQLKNIRFCNYIGKYFCASCHHNSYSCIPGRIINDWNFTRYPVSNFARDTLQDIQKEPLFNIESLNPSLYGKVSKLNKIKNYKTQLVNLKKYISTCSRADKLRTEYDEYYNSSNGDVHVYSLDEIISVKYGDLVKTLKQLIAEGEKHVKTCLVCQGKGFVCEFCRDDQTILFPFQLDTVSRCPNCFSCFHKLCYNNKRCPKCERIKERQRQRLKTVLSSEGDSIS